MATKQPKKAAKLAASAPATHTPATVLALTVAANQLANTQVASNQGTINPYKVRNDLLLKRQKAWVRYQKGLTLPTSAQVLMANAERPEYNHRRTLARNIVCVTGSARPADVDAHHIVSLTHWDALPARLHLFDIGIGINDGANGVFLPNNGTGLPGFPRAPYHRKDHSRSYHLAVFDELQFASDADEGRIALGELKNQILSGVLPL